MKQNREKKRVIFVVIGVLLVLGVLVYWIFGPLIFQGKDKLSREEIEGMYQDLSASAKASEEEESYIEGVNQPTELSISEADEGSLALIKREPRRETKTSNAFRREPPPKVSTLGGAVGRLRERLSKMPGFGFGGGAGGGGRFEKSDLDRWSKRFGKGSDFKGGNVATGPSAASKTKFGGKGIRQMPDPKAEQLASAIGKKFGEGGQLGRPVDPKTAAESLARSIPSDLRDQMAKIPERPDISRSDTSPQRERDPCKNVESVRTDDAVAQLLIGAGLMVGGAFMSAWKSEERDTVTVARGDVTERTTTTSMRTPEWASGLGNNMFGTGQNFLTQGVRGLMDSDYPMRECRGQRTVSSPMAGGGGGGPSGQGRGQQ